MNKTSSDYRGYFLGNNTNGKYINFDNAATTQCLSAVARVVTDFLPQYASLHRGKGSKAKYCSEMYETSKNMVAKFVNADTVENTVIYTKNTTEAINLLSNCLYMSNHNSVILSTDMEHHSNDLPWRKHFKVDYIAMDEFGQLDLNDLTMKLRKYKGKVRLVAVTGASNVTGLKNPIHLIARIAHQYGSEIFVDAAQLAPHAKIDMLPNDHLEHIDYIAFSSHKMYAPFGTGALIGWRKNFNFTSPDQVGGGTVDIVTPLSVDWLDSYERNEAGTPNLIGAIALTESIEMLNHIGMEQIEAYESALAQYAYARLQSIPEIEVYCPYNQYGRVSILAFNVRGIHHEKLANELEAQNIAVRNGCFCAQNYVRRIIGVNPYEKEKVGMVRISFALYNTMEEIDSFVQTLKVIIDKELGL